MWSIVFIAGLTIAASATASTPLVAQGLAQRVTANDGAVQVIYPSRPGVCGDGERLIANLFGRTTYYSGDAMMSGHGSWSRNPCLPGPTRVLATVVGGEITRLRTFVGPVPSSASATRTLDASASDAARWLGAVVSSAPSRVASQAMLPLVLADTTDPWPLLLRVARDQNRPGDVRRNALTWLATAVTEHLGIADRADESDDDQMREQAVFVLSQRHRDESVPELIDIARTSPHASTRRAAIFWLGQTGDPRAVDVFASLLGLR